MASPFIIEDLESEAQRRTGLRDFGSGDWRDALSRLLCAAEEEAGLNNAGEAIVRMQALDRLANRLEIQAWVKRHPKIEESRVEAPIILATLPRTGQTAAGWILDRDPTNLSLLSWFAKRPIPPPTRARWDDDPRVAMERARVRATPRAVMDMHLYDALYSQSKLTEW
jgi:hypothetical protein